ncbi:spondin domain-containing protein [Pseudoalteromonas sp. GB56]
MATLNRPILQNAALTGLILLGLSACGSDNDDMNVTMPVPPPAPVNYTYEVTVTNLTNAQPFSPIAIALHQEGDFWTLGESASGALEVLAEGGDNSALLAESTVMASTSGSAPLGAGSDETLSVTIQDISDAKLTVATMLVNTNDAFTGVNAVSLASLSVGSSMSLYGNTYDAGTEVNSEAMGTIPGPTDGGEGFNADREDGGFVSMHPGVVSMDDGLSNSILNAEHKFDNPAVMVKITRVQ